MDRAARQGDRVTVNYIGTLDNGRIFHSTENGEPLVFTIGANEVFPALEREIVGMTAGEVKNIVIRAADAYGPKLQQNILKVERASLPEGEAIEVGRKVQISFTGGEQRVLQIIEVTESTVTLDGNHPLSGFDLTFALRLDTIEEPWGGMRIASGDRVEQQGEHHDKQQTLRNRSGECGKQPAPELEDNGKERRDQNSRREQHAGLPGS